MDRRGGTSWSRPSNQSFQPGGKSSIAVLEVDELVRAGGERGGLLDRRLNVAGMHQLDIGALDELLRVAKAGRPRRIDRSKEAFEARAAKEVVGHREPPRRLRLSPRSALDEHSDESPDPDEHDRPGRVADEGELSSMDLRPPGEQGARDQPGRDSRPSPESNGHE